MSELSEECLPLWCRSGRAWQSLRCAASCWRWTGWSAAPLDLLPSARHLVRLPSPPLRPRADPAPPPPAPVDPPQNPPPTSFSSFSSASRHALSSAGTQPTGGGFQGRRREAVVTPSERPKTSSLCKLPPKSLKSTAKRGLGCLFDPEIWEQQPSARTQFKSETVKKAKGHRRGLTYPESAQFGDTQAKHCVSRGKKKSIFCPERVLPPSDHMMEHTALALPATNPH